LAGESAVRTTQVSFVALLLVTGPAAGHAASCPRPTEKIMDTAELFFGRALREGSEISDRQWREFKDDTLSRYFPDGFTDLDATGQWQEARSHAIVRERSRVVIVAAPEDAHLADAIEAVSAAFRGKFHQQSVGIITSEECAAF